MKRMREPSEKSKKAKKAKLGETSASRPPVPLIDSPSKSLPPPSRFVNLKQLTSSLPQTTPIYTQSETPPSTTKPSDTPTSNPQSHSFQKFNLSTTTLPVSIAEMLNEPISPISSTPSSPPYYVLSSDSEPSDPQSPTLAQIQARALASQPQPEPETNTPPSE
ncbi:proline-rich receptor-like protein kinase PERK2 [Lathyrus oleraceus]|uniref:proline-rich receptor-like protein kinase PERK2 n=1 Tax=Pisum sativum TaxID=3888 RepID=UPI0021D0E5BD|nr:proline-rich receptor-like protein kinase PERK2 [Pisum sativum]